MSIEKNKEAGGLHRFRGWRRVRGERMSDEIIVTDMSSEELELALDFAEKVWGLSREEAIEAIQKGDYVFRLEE